MEKNITLTDNGNNILYPKAQPCGIDTNNVIATLTANVTYTATVDCVACILVSQYANVKINDKYLINNTASNMSNSKFIIQLKKR